MNDSNTDQNNTVLEVRKRFDLQKRIGNLFALYFTHKKKKKKKMQRFEITAKNSFSGSNGARQMINDAMSTITRLAMKRSLFFNKIKYINYFFLMNI